MNGMKIGDKILIVLIVILSIRSYVYMYLEETGNDNHLEKAIAEVVYTIDLPVKDRKEVKIYSNDKKDWDIIIFDDYRTKVA